MASYRDDDRYDDEPRRPPPRAMPTTVKVAGIMWMVYGGLGIAMNLLQLVMVFAAGGRGGGGGPPGVEAAAAAVPGIGCGILIAAAFLFVGYQTVTGTAKDTLGNGIGSLALGVLAMSCMAFALIGSAAQRNPQLAGMVAGIGLVAGAIAVVFLIVPGILALVGRSDYLAWKRGAQRRTDRRRQRDDWGDEDEGQPV